MPLENINGTMLHYETRGDGVPIVFIHPPLLTSANFRYQQAQLSDEFQVITFDIRGHGQSDPSEMPVTYELIAEDIKHLMDHLKIDKAFVAGYSTGGSIALEAMLAYPDRFEGGILISAMSEASDFMLRNRIRLAMGLSGWKPTIDLLKLVISWGNSDRTQTFRNLLRDSRSGNSQNIHEYYSYSLNYNCTEELSQITSPILLLYGGKDRGFKRYRKKLQQGLSQFKTVILQKEKHQLPTKAAADLNKVMTHWIHTVIAEKPNTLSETDSMPAALLIAQEEPGEQLQYSE